MATPSVSASLDKITYAPGELMTLTVTYGDADTKALIVTVTITDTTGATGTSEPVTAVIDPSALTVTDNLGKVWAKVSDTGTVAVYTATA